MESLIFIGKLSMGGDGASILELTEVHVVAVVHYVRDPGACARPLKLQQIFVPEASVLFIGLALFIPTLSYPYTRALQSPRGLSIWGSFAYDIGVICSLRLCILPV